MRHRHRQRGRRLLRRRLPYRWLDDGGWGLFVYAGGLPRCSAGASLYGTTPIAVGRWSHLACVYDGSFMRVYVDGVETSSTSVATPIPSPGGTDVVIGANSPSGDAFDKMIDEVRVWRVGLPGLDLCAIAGTCP